MAQAIPGSYYLIQSGDALSTIAQRAYGNGDEWQLIYDANRQVIGNSPDRISAGQVLYIPSLSSSRPVPCTVTVSEGLNIRVAATTQATIIACYPPSAALNFVTVVNGETVSGNSRWGHSAQGHYFWLGGTDRPNG